MMTQTHSFTVKVRFCAVSILRRLNLGYLCLKRSVNWHSPCILIP